MNFNGLTPARVRGFTLIEVLVVLAVGTMIMVGMAQAMKTYGDNIANHATADQQKQVRDASLAFMRDNIGAITGAAGPTTPYPVSIANLVAGGYLPAGFSDTNAYGQTVSVQIVEPTPGKLQGYVLSSNPAVKISGSNLRKIAQLVGAEGGYAEAAGMGVSANGAFGAWSSNLDAIGGSPSSSTVVTSLFVAEAAAASAPSGDALMRTASPGHPELNRMSTALDMNGNNLTSINQATAANVTATGTVSASTLTAGTATITNASGTNLNYTKINGNLHHTNGYLQIDSYDPGMYGSGSALTWYDPNSQRLTLWNQGANTIDLKMRSLVADGNVNAAGTITGGNVIAGGELVVGALAFNSKRYGGAPWSYETISLPNGNNFRFEIGGVERANIMGNGVINATGGFATPGNISAWDIRATGGLYSNNLVASPVFDGNEYYANGWFRSNGDTGWYNQKWAGGWHMTDGTWIRAYNGKSVYTPGEMRANRMSTEGRMTAGEFVQIDGQANLGWGCGPNGLMGRLGDGALVNCKNGVWQLPGGGFTSWGGSWSPPYKGSGSVAIAGGEAFYCGLRGVGGVGDQDRGYIYWNGGQWILYGQRNTWPTTFDWQCIRQA